MLAKTPLAWKNLTHDARRLLVAVSGVGFAVVLIFVELGFMNALLESTVQILQRLNGELVIVSAARYAMPAREQFDLRRVHQSQGVAGVKAAYPVYLETFGVLRRHGARGFPIRVLAFDPQQDVVKLNSLSEWVSALRAPGSALTDRANRSKYQIPAEAEAVPDYRGELAGKSVRLIGSVQLGIDFANEGNLIMTPENFAQYFPQRVPGRDPLSRVDLAVVQLQQGADRQTVQRNLQEALGSDVNVLTRQALVAREMDFWRTSAPVGYIFLVGVYMGFVVGVIICYQIIYADITDHMREFATLKAMGYTNGYFVQLVLRQAVYLSLMGFVPGVVLSYFCYRSMSSLTGLTMNMTFSGALTVLLVTMFMCVVSGLLAVRKLLSLDPAELF